MWFIILLLIATTVTVTMLFAHNSNGDHDGFSSWMGAFIVLVIMGWGMFGTLIEVSSVKTDTTNYKVYFESNYTVITLTNGFTHRSDSQTVANLFKTNAPVTIEDGHNIYGFNTATSYSVLGNKLK